MQLVDIGNLLLTVTPNVFHYTAWEQPDSYIVWAEDGQGDASYSDNVMDLQAIQGTIDFFTKTEFDSMFDTIQRTLNTSVLSWRLSSIQHEEETGYTHYEWIWEVDNDVG